MKNERVSNVRKDFKFILLGLCFGTFTGLLTASMKTESLIPFFFAFLIPLLAILNFEILSKIFKTKLKTFYSEKSFFSYCLILLVTIILIALELLILSYLVYVLINL